MPDEVTYELPDDVHVLVATPNYTNLFSSEAHTNHIECVSEWKKWGVKYNWMIVGRAFVHFARSQQCQTALDGDFSHIFWVDDDCMIDPEILPRFLSHDKDVVIAPYPMRKSPFEIGILSSRQFRCTSCGELTICDDEVTSPETMECSACGETAHRDFHEHSAYRNITASDLDQGLVSVDGGGTHAMLIKTSILRNARGFKAPKPGDPVDPENDSYPHGAVELYQKMHGLFDSLDEQNLIDHYIGELPDQSRTFEEEAESGAKPFFIMPKVGTEDMLWCYRAKCKGVEIYADTDVFANHIGFPPVITRGFTEQAEAMKKDPENNRLPPGQVVLQKVGDRGRDHMTIKADASASLT